MRGIRISFVEHAIRILAVAIVALITAGQAGWLTKTSILPPAAITPLEGHAFQIQVVKPWYPSWFLSFFYPSDSMSDPAISSLQLTEGLRRLGPPHSLHRDIEERGGGRFSHWYNWLYFSASDNSDPRTNGRTYSVAQAPAGSRIAAIPALLMLALILARLRMGRVSEAPELAVAREHSAVIARAWLGVLYLASWGVIGAAATYVGTIIYGFASGDALPTATIYFLWPSAHSLHRIGLFLPWGVLIVAMTGAALGWMPESSSRDVLHRGEHRLITFWGLAGIPVILLAFLFDMSGGGWSGQYLPTDINFMSNAGLTPYSDAGAYYSSAFEIGYWGHWNNVASQRPLAAALRSFTVLLGGEKYPNTLIVQTLLVAFGIGFALRRIVAWRGFWVGAALFALVDGLVRPFLLTALTENLGFLWAVVSIGFFAESFRQRSLPMGLLGFATLTGALMTRMGSMFNIPALMLWLPFAFARQWRLRLIILIGTVGIALGAVAVNELLSWLYAAPGSEAGGNFSSTLCGLAHGSNWGECFKLLSAQIGSAQSFHAVNQILYAEAVRAFRADPFIALHALWNNAYAFVYDLPAMLLEQYQRIGYLDRSYLIIGLLLLIPGWVYLLAKPGRSLLLSFALLMIVSSIFSSAVIFADDGTRTMIVTYVFVAFLVSLGFSAPGSFVPAKIAPLSWQRSTYALAVTLFVLLVIPAVQGAAVRWMSRFAPPISPTESNISVIPGRPIITGFLVTPDGWKRISDFPSLNLSEYTKMYLAIYTPELGPSALSYLPQAPFAVVFAVPQDREYGFSGRLRSRSTLAYYIGPPELMTDGTAHHWRLELDHDRSPAHGVPFRLVTKATPVE
jgi:hypothetical protein